MKFNRQVKFTVTLATLYSFDKAVVLGVTLPLVISWCEV